MKFNFPKNDYEAKRLIAFIDWREKLLKKKNLKKENLKISKELEFIASIKNQISKQAANSDNNLSIKIVKYLLAWGN